MLAKESEQSPTKSRKQTTGVGMYGANTRLIALLQVQGIGKASLLEGVTHAMIFEVFTEQMLACGLHMT